MASLNYSLFFQKLADGDVDFGMSFKAMLVGDGYTPNKDTDEFRDDVTDEASGTGYTAGGVAITPTVSYDAGTDQVRVTWTDVSWASSSITGRYLVIYRDSGSAATDELVHCIDNGSEVTSSNSLFTFDITAPLVIQN